MKAQTLNLRLITAAMLITMLAGCASLPQAQSDDETTAPLEASGFLEADSVSVVSETSGRVAEVLVDEGDTVMVGQVVVRLDDTLLKAERAQAVAAVNVARANLAQLKAGADEQALAAAEAAIHEAEAAVDGAQYASGSAWAAASNPQDVNVQIAAVQSQVDIALRQVEIGSIQLEEARIKLGWLKTVGDEEGSEEQKDGRAIEFQEYQVAILEANVRAAEAQYQGLVTKLNLLKQQAERPLGAIAQARSTQARIGIAEAQVQLAQAQYDLIANGALPEEIAIVEAQVALMESQVALIDARIAQLTLIAPVDGIVATRSIQVGETAQAGVALMTISDLSSLELIIYIPETQIGRVRLGAPVEIAVDAYSGETFEGVVTAIDTEAEFTPRNVQTEEDRVSLVFAVHVEISNPEGKLKPGMPADAVIEEAE